MSLACGGGGGGGSSTPTGPPPCQDTGINATAILRPGNSNCNTDNTLSVRVSNQSCEALTVTAVTTQFVDPGGSCGDGTLFEDIDIEDVTIDSKTAETLELLTFSWCCNTCTFNFSCMLQDELTLHTNQGDIGATSSKIVTKKFGPFCEACTFGASQFSVAGAEVGPRCSIGVEGRQVF